MSGTIIPSFLNVCDSTRGPMNSSGQYGNVALRMGEVIGVLYPEDPYNISKLFIEYRVQVQSRDGSDPGTSTTYNNVIAANLFGGGADQFTYTLRKGTPTEKLTGYGTGSKVLLLCINGEKSSATIIGGIRDGRSQSTTPDQKDDGHHLHFIFNGLQADIDKDGQLLVTFNGPTDATGQLLSSADANAVGSTIQMTKDGSITIQNATEDVIVDHPNQQVHIDAASNVTIKSAGVLTGDATDATVLGTTYRKAEDEMLSSIAGLSKSIGSAISDMSTNMNLAATQPAWANAASYISLAANNCFKASAQFAKLQAAINKFINAGPYLSDKNFSD